MQVRKQQLELDRNKRLVPNRKRSTSRLYIVTLFISLLCRVAAAKSLQSCLTLQPHKWQPTRLPRPWDSPGKNTGVGCHFLLQCMKVKSESEVAQSCPTLSEPIDCSLPASSIHGIFQARVLEWGAIAFSVYAEYIMRNVGLEEAQAGIKIAGRNINNFRYADMLIGTCQFIPSAKIL